jgi:drug/metabolite transporter (DMT)-like permease
VLPQVLSAPPDAVLAFLYLGIGASALGFVLWAMALVDAPASVVASAIYATPPLATVSGWIVLGERPAPWVLAGGVVILAAVTLVMRKGVAPDDLPRRTVARARWSPF